MARVEMTIDEVKWLYKIGFDVSTLGDHDWCKEMDDNTIYTLRPTFNGSGYQLLKTYDVIKKDIPIYGYEEIICEGASVRETLLPFHREDIIDGLLD